MALNTTRSTSMSLQRLASSSAPPARARRSPRPRGRGRWPGSGASAPLAASAMSSKPLGGLGVDLPDHRRSRRRAAPSRPWPAGRGHGRRTPAPCSPEPRYLLMVLALAGSRRRRHPWATQLRWRDRAGQGSARRCADPYVCIDLSRRAGRRGFRAAGRSRPASSSSSSAACTSGAAASHSRISSSTASGSGPRARDHLLDQGVADRGGCSGGGRPCRPRRRRAPDLGRGAGGSARAAAAPGPPGRRRRSRPDARRRAAAGWCRDGAGPCGLPGTAITSRPYSSARRAVISEPDAGAASTTTTPSASPAITRLRRGKSLARAVAPRAAR